jgi:raffinose/stachyose/melibiose transport system permease protein
MRSLARGHRSPHTIRPGQLHAGDKAHSRRQLRARIAALIIYVPLWAFALAIIYPLFWMVTAGLKTNGELFANAWALPQNPQWSNWSQAWDLGVGRFVLNSVIVTASSIAGVVVVSAWAAYALSRLHFPMRNVIFILIIGGMMLSPQVALIPLFRLLRTLHLYNTYWGLIVLDVAFRVPFTVFLMRAYMLGLPREVEESATVDGANHWTIFWRIVLPLSKPIIISAALLQALFSWNEFMFALTFIQDQALKTLPVGLLDMQSRVLTNWPVLLSGLSIAALPMIALFIVAQRRFVRGLAEGWGKG